MPFINIKLSKGQVGMTAEEKAEVIKRSTQVLVDVLNKDPKTITVLIQEESSDNWGAGGVTVTELNANRK